MTAPGDLLSRDYQFQLDRDLLGCGSQGVSLDNATPISGFGVPDAKTQDVVKNFGDGSYANPDLLSMRLITIPVILRGAPSTCVTNFKTLTGIWVNYSADIDLAFQLPGWGKFYVMGRPRGAKDDFRVLNRGAIRVLLRFDCPNPTITDI